jgi:RNA polymerase sigma-70 factor (ECF subfamily)
MSGVRMTGNEMDQPDANRPRESAEWILEVLDQYEGRLVRYASCITQDAERARDVVQEAFLRLLREDRDRVGPILAEWLFRVCRNLALDVRGKETRMKFLDDERARETTSPAPSPPAVVEQAEARSEILRMVDRLPDNQREVLRLKFQEGLSYKEISRITSHSVSHVGVLLHNAIKSIRLSIPSSSDLAPHV